jgi:hypothetical protein
MLNNVATSAQQGGGWYSNWLELMLHHTNSFYEVAVIGKEADEKRAQIEQNYHPNKILVGGKKENGLPLLEYKSIEGETWIYVCVDKACQMPTNDVSKALELIK